MRRYFWLVLKNKTAQGQPIQYRITNYNTDFPQDMLRSVSFVIFFSYINITRITNTEYRFTQKNNIGSILILNTRYILLIYFIIYLFHLFIYAAVYGLTFELYLIVNSTSQQAKEKEKKPSHTRHCFSRPLALLIPVIPGTGRHITLLTLRQT